MDFICEQYMKFIQDIIISRGQWDDGVKNSGVCERHHIIPVCLGGLPKILNWDKHDNIIWLYPREHFMAHKLLAEENPKNQKLVYAYLCMSRMGNNVEYRNITEDEYDSIKRFAKLSPGPATGSKHTDEWKNNMSNRLKGHSTSDVTRQKISKANSYPKNELTKKKICITLKNKYKSGELVCPWAGSHLTEEQKEKCRITGAMSSRNTKWYTNDTESIRVKIDSEILEGFRPGRAKLIKKDGQSNG